MHKRNKDELNRNVASALRGNTRAQISFGTQRPDPKDHFFVEYDYDAITPWSVTKR